MSQTIAIDIDGTLCPECKTFERSLAVPYPEAKDLVNALYDGGNIILMYTARSWAEYAMTEQWLQKYEFKYHALICGKPIYDYICDDRSHPTLLSLYEKLQDDKSKNKLVFQSRMQVSPVPIYKIAVADWFSFTPEGPLCTMIDNTIKNKCVLVSMPPNDTRYNIRDDTPVYHRHVS